MDNIITFEGQKYKKITDLTEVSKEGDSYIHRNEQLCLIGTTFLGKTFKHLFSDYKGVNPDFSAYRPITKTIKKII